jgi:hypothetical protein
MQNLSLKLYAAALRLKGDRGVNQATEVGGLVGVAVAVTGAIAAKSTDLGDAVTNFITGKLG